MVEEIGETMSSELAKEMARELFLAELIRADDKEEAAALIDTHLENIRDFMKRLGVEDNDVDSGLQEYERQAAQLSESLEVKE
jgi:phage terminase Nu1 subunit (DNA packaging protein)